MTDKEQLTRYYSNKSKHSNYQVLAPALQEYMGVSAESLEIKTRQEKERFDFLLKHIDFAGKSVLDIGANTGYFTFEAQGAGATNVDYFEGNKEHAEFVELAVRALGVANTVKITNNYYEFDGTNSDYHDVTLLFNVLHHLGDDYGDKNLSKEKAKENIIKQLNNMSKFTDTLVFQVGFNWQGNPEQPLFDHGTKQEMISYIKKGIEGVYDVLVVGIAQRSEGGLIEYIELNDENIKRDDSLGEFLNRPIFVLKSKGV